MTLTLITLVRTYQVYQHIFSDSILTRLRLTGHLSPMLANQLPPDVEAVWVDSMAFFLLFLLRKRQCQNILKVNSLTCCEFDLPFITSGSATVTSRSSHQPLISPAGFHFMAHVWKWFIYLLNLWPFNYDLIGKFSFSTMKFGTFP